MPLCQSDPNASAAVGDFCLHALPRDPAALAQVRDEAEPPAATAAASCPAG